MRRAWTADWHLGHSNILRYCDRPFKDCHTMNKALMREANMRLYPDDICVHVGDFCVNGATKYKDWLQELRGKWTFMRGNHDKNNGVKTVCDSMFARISHFNVFVSHIPYFYSRPERTATEVLNNDLIEVIENNCDFAVCGHVHEKWQVSQEGKIPTINVGVDVNKFMPIFDDELVNIYLKHKQ